MKHEDLIGRMRGLYKNKQYLEAFLLQSAYIEELIRVCARYTFTAATYPMKVEEKNEIKLSMIWCDK